MSTSKKADHSIITGIRFKLFQLRRHKGGIFVVFLLTALILGAAGVYAHQTIAGGGGIPGFPQNTSKQQNTPSVTQSSTPETSETGTIVQRPFLAEYSYVGSVGAEKESVLSAKTSGRISSLMPQVGDEVGHGALVAQLSGDELYAQLAAAETAQGNAEEQLHTTRDLSDQQVTSANRNLDTVRAQRDLVNTQLEQQQKTASEKIQAAEAEVAVAKESVESAPDAEKAVKQKQYEQAQEELDVLRASLEQEKRQLEEQVDVADQQVRQAESGVTAAQRQKDNTLQSIETQVDSSEDSVTLAQIAVNNTRVTAPYYGTIVEKHAEQGDVVGPGQPIYTIANQVYLVRIQIPDTDASLLQEGMNAEVTLDGSEQSYTATVSNIYPSVDRQSRTLTVELAFVTMPESIAYGLTARVTIFQEEQVGYFVEQQYIVPSYDGPYIIFADGRKKFVQTGREDGALIEISYPGITEGIELQKP